MLTRVVFNQYIMYMYLANDILYMYILFTRIVAED